MKLMTAILACGVLFGANRVLPPAEVPGVVDPGITQANIHQTICQPNYTARVRNVTAAMKKQVYARDGVTPHMPECCEVDHLVSLELGGQNDLKNLWAQPYEPFPGARDKDKVETALHRDVCAGKLTLKQAQTIIRTDWFSEYKKRFGNARIHH